MTESSELYKSPDELRELLRRAAARLHYINRVSGECGYRWELAEMIHAVADLCLLQNDREIQDAFGSGYVKGKLDKAERRRYLLDLLDERLNR